MKFETKFLKDLKIGDIIYIHTRSKDGITVGIELLGQLCEVLEPSNCMGIVDFGVSQNFIVYNKNYNNVKCYSCFEYIPVMVRIG